MAIHSPNIDVTGCLLVRDTDLYGNPITVMLTATSKSGSIEERLRKIRKVLSVEYFTKFENELFIKNPYQWRNGIYTLCRDTFSFFQLERVDYDNWDVSIPITNPKLLLENFKNISAQVPAGVYLRDAYEKRLIRANAGNVLSLFHTLYNPN